jgi:hypothetical protein
VLTVSQHNDIVVLVVPNFQPDGNLPPGIHWAEWAELEVRFGQTPHRRHLLNGCRRGLEQLRCAGCMAAYLDGSFVTTKDQPGDFDACWDVVDVDPDKIDPVFLDFDDGRAAQKARFGGEFFPAQLPEGDSGKTFLEFFQIDKNTGDPKGIVGLDLGRWKV